MILEKSREFTVNMGNYESTKIGAKVVLDSDKLSLARPEGTSDFEALSEHAEDLLTQALAADVKEVSELTRTRDSFILSWKQA